MAATASSGTAVVALPTDTQILITREFDAPRHLVYRAFTTPELIKRWWSGGRGEVTSAEVDLRPGGAWRYVLVTDNGFEVGFHGVYREVVPDELLVCTEVYEGVPGGDDDPAVCTYTFTASASGERTTLTLLTEVSSREVRDMIMDSGMEAGMQAGWDLVEQIAISLR
jgi:uncharacterized protein YndB with AHSA1/START domain